MQKFTTYKPISFLLPFIKKRQTVCELPTDWGELDSEQYARVCAVIFNHLGENSTTHLRLLVFQAITGYVRSKKAFTEDEADQINGNIYILSQHIHFPFKMVFKNPDIIPTLSQELREAMKTRFLFEMYEPELKDEIQRYGGLLEYRLETNFNFRSNLIPSITIDGVVYHGPRFNINDDGVLDTDLLAGEWIDVCDYMNFLSQSRKEKYLANVAACLYRCNRKTYSTAEAQKMAIVLGKAKPEELRAVWALVKCIQEYFFNDPNFNILFTRKEKGLQSKKIEVGSSAVLYQLSKDGYGSLADVVNMPVTDFFSIQIKNLSDFVAGLKALKKNPAEIARDYNMDINIVLKFF